MAGDASVTVTKTGALEIFRRFKSSGSGMYREAYKRGHTLTQFLNNEFRGQREKGDEGLDGFQLLLKAANLPTRSLHDEGVLAVTYGEFEAAEDQAGKALFPEFMARQFRALGHRPRQSQGRATYMSQDAPVGSLENAYVDNLNINWDTQLTSPIPLADLVARTEGIAAMTYRSFFLEHNASQQSMARVAEGTEIPRFKLQGTEVPISLFKFGGGVEVTYEDLLTMRMDTIAYHLQAMAVQNEVNKVAKAIDTLINGDGNPNTSAAVVNLTTLDPDASAGDPITLKAWLAFQMLFDPPYSLTTLLGPNTDVLNLFLMTAGTPTAPLYQMVASKTFGGFTPINQSLDAAVRVGWTNNVGSLKLLGFDRRRALERVYLIGANVSEVERFITSQVEVMVMTEIENFAVLDRNAARVIDLNA